MHPTGHRPLRLASSLALVGAAVALIAWRAPVYLVAGSFWAEEGTLFFARAWSASWAEALVQHPRGYLLLYTNLATALAAKLVSSGALSLAHAPLVTACAAFGAQLLPIALLASGRAAAWRSPIRRSAGVAIVLFGALTGGIWLTTTDSWVFLTLAAVLVLLEPARVGMVRGTLYAAVLTLAGLTGPAVSATIPMFAWKAVRARRRRAVVLQLGIVTACGLVQALCYVASVREGTLPARAEPLGLPVLAALVWKRVIVASVLGPAAADATLSRLQGVAGPTLASPGALWLGGILLLLVAGGLVWLAIGLPRSWRILLPGTFALLTIVSIVGALGDKLLLLRQTQGNQRYFYVSGVLLLVMMLGNVRSTRPGHAAVCAFILAVALAGGVARYRASVWWHPGWPAWDAEVRTWERDPRHALRIWPPGWTVVLPAPRGR